MHRRVLCQAAVGCVFSASRARANAITTGATGLNTMDTMVPSGPELIPCYVAYPKRGGPFPCVIVIHEVSGVREYIKDVCRRLASRGYYSIAPYLCFRQGDATKMTDMRQLLETIIDKVVQEQMLADLDRVTEWVGTQRAARASHIGVTGFCWGGNATWMYAAHNPRIKAAVAWYGRLAGEPTLNRREFPVDRARDLKVPVLGLYAGDDERVPVDQVARMRTALTGGRSGSKIIVYPGAKHGFHADDLPSYDEKVARTAWNELLAWFKINGLT